MSYLFGGNTDLTYEQMLQRRAVAEGLRKQMGRTPRNAGEGLAYIGAAIGARLAENRAAKAEAKRVWEAAQRNIARASTGTLPHLARVEQGGHIVEWPIGELSLLDAEGERQPVNRHAIAVPAMKAVYDQAGLDWPDDIASESGGPEAEPEATSVAASAVAKARVQAELTLIDIMEV